MPFQFIMSRKEYIKRRCQIKDELMYGMKLMSLADDIRKLWDDIHKTCSIFLKVMLLRHNTTLCQRSGGSFGYVIS
jgi:hypothetical protein